MSAELLTAQQARASRLAMVHCDVCAQEHEATHACEECGLHMCAVLAVGPYGHGAMRATRGHKVVPLDVPRDDNSHVLAECRKRAGDLLRAALNVAQARVGVDAYHVQAMTHLHAYFDEVRGFATRSWNSSCACWRTAPPLCLRPVHVYLLPLAKTRSVVPIRATYHQ